MTLCRFVRFFKRRPSAARTCRSPSKPLVPHVCHHRASRNYSNTCDFFHCESSNKNSARALAYSADRMIGIAWPASSSSLIARNPMRTTRYSSRHDRLVQNHRRRDRLHHHRLHRPCCSVSTGTRASPWVPLVIQWTCPRRLYYRKAALSFETACYFADLRSSCRIIS